MATASYAAQTRRAIECRRAASTGFRLGRSIIAILFNLLGITIFICVFPTVDRDVSCVLPAETRIKISSASFAWRSIESWRPAVVSLLQGAFSAIVASKNIRLVPCGQLSEISSAAVFQLIDLLVVEAKGASVIKFP